MSRIYVKKHGLVASVDIVNSQSCCGVSEVRWLGVTGELNISSKERREVLSLLGLSIESYAKSDRKSLLIGTSIPLGGVKQAYSAYHSVAHPHREGLSLQTLFTVRKWKRSSVCKNVRTGNKIALYYKKVNTRVGLHKYSTDSSLPYTGGR